MRREHLSSAMPPGSRGPAWLSRSPGMVALLYAGFAALWIAASDRLLALILADATLIARVSSLKGFLFVAVTALLLYLLLRDWRAPRLAGSPPVVSRQPRYLWLSFLALALVVPLVGVGVVHLHGRQTEREAFASLQAVAQLKAGQIENWLAERDGEGQALMLSRGFAVRVDRWLREGAVGDQEMINYRLEALRVAHHYEGVVLLDLEGRVRATVGERQDIPEQLHSLLPQALAGGKVVRSPLYRDAAGQIHLDWLVPVPLGGPQGKPVALVVFHVEPQRFLFPLIQTWPTPSPSAETVLSRRDGDSVLFLNELRHRKDTALSYRYPLDRADFPATVSILSARPQTLAGTDYRGVAVLAAVRPVQGTPWHLVAKVDRDEVMKPLRTLVWWVSSIAFCAVAAVTAVIFLLWRQQRRADQLAMQAQAAEGIRALNQQLEQRVAERTAQLEAANRELESFAYAASHDLKAPLRGIDGYGRLLEEECSAQLNAEGRTFLRNIRQGAAQMHQLIDDLLAYARIERSTPQRVALALPAVVDAVVAERRAEAAAAGVSWHVEVPALEVVADRDGLALALRNLLDNALKFSRHVPLPTIEIGARGEPGKVVLWVRDNGIGFDMKFQDRIFEIFSRLERVEDYPGTGVGLALVRKAMLRMGGRVWAESAVGQGAVFFLELPTVRPPTTADMAPALPRQTVTSTDHDR